MTPMTPFLLSLVAVRHVLQFDDKKRTGKFLESKQVGGKVIKKLQGVEFAVMRFETPEERDAALKLIPRLMFKGKVVIALLSTYL